MALRKGEIPDDLFVAHGKEIEAVFRRAVRAALLAHKRAGNPVAAWVDGRVVIVPPEEIPTWDEEAQD